MKFQNMIRVQLMLLGLGAGLVLAKPVCAQQETDPTLFEATSDASEQAQAGFNVPAPPQAAVAPSPEIAVSPAVENADVVAWSTLDRNMIATLMVGIGSIALVGIAEAVRGSRRRTWRARASSEYPSGATAN